MRARTLLHASIFPALLAGLAASIVTTTASAQGRRLFVWSGRVDREVRLTMRGEDLDTRFVGDNEEWRQRSHVDAPLPDVAGRVTVQVLDGRGDVDVVQQPSARNDYAAVLRIRDPRGGADQYRVAAYWQPVDDRLDRWRNRRGGDRSDVDDDQGREDRGGNRDRDRDRNGANDRYGAGAMHWTGNVDAAMEIRIQGRRVDYRNVSGAGMRDVRYGFSGAPLPDRAAQVYVSANQGRGTVSVVQQPSEWNGYTAVIRVRDPQGGFGFYDFDVRWR